MHHYLVVFVLCFLFFALLEITNYSKYFRAYRESISKEQQRLRCGIRAGGSGMFINKSTGKLEQTNVNELSRRFKILESVSDLQINIKILLESVFTCIMFSSILTIVYIVVVESWK